MWRVTVVNMEHLRKDILATTPFPATGLSLYHETPQIVIKDAHWSSRRSELRQLVIQRRSRILSPLSGILFDSELASVATLNDSPLAASRYARPQSVIGPRQSDEHQTFGWRLTLSRQSTTEYYCFVSPESQRAASKR